VKKGKYVILWVRRHCKRGLDLEDFCQALCST
jgi:hypothetical protein